jgi:hypothetical protein
MRKWHAVGLFCEDIRQEANALYTLLGVMPDNMKVPRMPGSFAKLGMYVRVRADVDADIGPIALKIQSPDGTIASFDGFSAAEVKKEQEKAKANGFNHVGLMIQTVAGNLHMKTPGRIDLVVEIDGTSEICGSLRVFIESSDASPPPSQSLPASPPT